MSTATTKRRYDSSRRKRQAEQTRADVLVAAMRLFNERGWAGTTVAAIAEEAGVAVETVYSGFGSKKVLVRDAADAAVVGDAEPVPLVDRPEFARMGEGTLTERIAAATEFLADTHERAAGIWQAVHDAAEGDDELTAWLHEAQLRRRLDVGRSLGRILDRPVDGPMVDLLWTLYDVPPYRLLVDELGYSREQYRAALADASLRLLGAESEG
jgi:AcrR family transcriptional regulator